MNILASLIISLSPLSLEENPEFWQSVGWSLFVGGLTGCGLFAYNETEKAPKEGANTRRGDKNDEK